MQRVLHAVGVLALLALTGCQENKSGSTSSAASDGASTPAATTTSEGGTITPGASGAMSATSTAAEVTLPSGLRYQDLVTGSGAEARSGQRVTVHYTGWLTDGTKFDSSKDRGAPFQFTLGRGEVIPGWDQGVAGMKVGGTRKLSIPPDLGYGARGAGGVIPPNATLVFEVELLGVQ